MKIIECTMMIQTCFDKMGYVFCSYRENIIRLSKCHVSDSSATKNIDLKTSFKYNKWKYLLGKRKPLKVRKGDICKAHWIVTWLAFTLNGIFSGEKMGFLCLVVSSYYHSTFYSHWH